MNFKEKLAKIVEKNNSLVCIGLDPDTAKLPEGVGQFDFNKQIIDQTHDLVCAYKPNSAFYESQGVEGIQVLKDTCDYLRENHSDIPIILDAKRGDIGNTNSGYAKFAFEYLNTDGITLHPYMGGESLSVFLEYTDKQLFIMGRNSNSGAGEFQDLKVDGRPLYLKVIESFTQNWNKSGNVSFVAGATYPEELAEIRAQVGDEAILLIPGIGAQGGDVESTVKAGTNSDGTNAIISTSRAVIFANDPRKAAKALKDDINENRRS